MLIRLRKLNFLRIRQGKILWQRYEIELSEVVPFARQQLSIYKKLMFVCGMFISVQPSYCIFAAHIIIQVFTLQIIQPH
ncbi:hypothetical protein TBC1_111634 [Lentimicrobium saccharophilum]|uniref:Uncharacterized protein n=1 Tax=Lentimicrobium saccharophilum TaxID=1678841 RepID=A0A0S7C2U2_9BACT|nr:hypothetical protein TBC1_111634 [Lentimicrobium saccharophilum]